MCLVKSIAAVIVLGVIAAGALWYLQSPSGTWVVDREAMHEKAGDDVVSRLTDSLIPNLELELIDSGKFTMRDGGDALFSGTWELDGAVLRFADSPLDSADYTRPERLTIVVFEKTIIFKRR